MLPITLILFLGLIFLPQWWVKRVFTEFSDQREDFPGTGGEFAEHIIETFKVDKALVKLSDQADHFDPETKTIALTDQNYHSKSLTAIAIAAHELGHMIQLEQGNPWLRMRTSLAKLAQKLDSSSRVAFILLPLALLITRSPAVTAIFIAFSFSGALLNVLIHMVTLPMELDASFGKALPLLKTGQYINREDEPKVRKILWAAALTYLASALSSLLNLARWFRVIRR